MANHPPPDGTNDDFFDQIFSIPSSFAASAADAGTLPFGGDSSAASGGEGPSIFSLGLSLDQQHGNPNHKDICGNRIREEDRNSSEAEREHPTVQLASLFPPYGHNSSIHQIRPNSTAQALHVQAMQNTMAVVPQPPPPRPRVRARRGQATDPHSIAERLRRERIAERIRALQELVPSTNKTDRAAMLDEIVDYVKFLRLQVKVLSMSRLGGAGAVAQLVADIPLSLVEGDSGESKPTQHHVWEKWTTDGTERQVAKLMEEDVGAAMQFLQSKALCIMPISLAATIYQVHSQAESPPIKPEPDTPS